MVGLLQPRKGPVSIHSPFLKVLAKGRTGQLFDANPLRIWYVTTSHAVVEGEDFGPIGPLPEQARMADFYFPQRGIFAIGRVFVSPLRATPRGSKVVASSP